MNTKQVIGLFGFGVVGEGLYHVLKNSKAANAEIKKICIKDKTKKRSLDEHHFSNDMNELLSDPEINLIVELIDQAEDAYTIVTEALKSGKSVVSGNKKMIASHLNELIALQKEYGGALLYDASACGSIPVIRNLEEYYDNDLFRSVTGILNGSSNFILSKIFNEAMNYSEALKLAQELGFAESNPSFDVNGYDSLYKLVIIACHALGTVVSPEEVFNYGISGISDFDIQYAREKGWKIKLVAQLKKLSNDDFTMFIIPKLVRSDEYIFNVEDEYNGVVIEGEFYEKQFMFGKGAGALPTGSAVLSDITARSYDYTYEYKKQKYFNVPVYTQDAEIEIYLRYKDMIDLSYFDFEHISEKYSGKDFNYVVGRINIEKLMLVRDLISKLDVFIAYTGNGKEKEYDTE